MKSNLSFVLFPVFLLAVACSKDTAPAEMSPETEEAVQIVFSAGTDASASEADAPTEASADTRAIFTHDGSGFRVEWKGSDDYPLDYDRIGIVVSQEQSTDLIAGAVNIPYKPTQSGKRSPLTADGTPLSGPVRGQSYRFCSYYPYDPNQTFPVSTYHIDYVFDLNKIRWQTQSAPNDFSHLPSLTLMVAEPVTVRIPEEGVPVVDLHFKHVLATLQMKIVNDRDEPVTINRIGVSGNDWYTILEHNIIAEELDSRSVLRQRLTVASPVALDKGADPQLFWLAISRQDMITSPVKFEIETDKGFYRFSKPLPAEGLSRGRNYTMDIILPQTPGEGETWTEY